MSIHCRFQVSGVGMIDVLSDRASQKAHAKAPLGRSLLEFLAKAGNNLVSFGHWLQAQTQNSYRKPLNQNDGNPAPATAHGMLRKDTANRPHMGFTGAPSDSDTLGSKRICMSPIEGLRREGKAAALYTTGIQLTGS